MKRFLSPNEQMTAAVVGTGFIGPVHVEALQRAGVRVSGICGSTPAKSEDSAQRLGLSRAYANLADVLADDTVDVVHLATPNRFHFAQASEVLRAGKHVLCEKPLAMNSRESAGLVQLAADSGRCAGVAYNIRFYPMAIEAASRLANANFGHILHIHGSYVQDWLLHETDFNWRVLAEDGGELRAVADIGTHWLDLLQHITGCRVTAVCADLQTVHTTRKRPVGGSETFAGKSPQDATAESMPVTTEDAGCILLKLDNGARGSMHVSQVTAGRKNCLRFEIAGTHQALSWNSEIPNSLWIGHRDRPNESLIRDPALLSAEAALFASYPGGHNEGFPDTFKQLFRAFYEYLSAGDYSKPAPFPTFEDGHREVLLCEAILASHRQQCWIEFDSIADA